VGGWIWEGQRVATTFHEGVGDGPRPREVPRGRGERPRHEARPPREGGARWVHGRQGRAPLCGHGPSRERPAASLRCVLVRWGNPERAADVFAQALGGEDRLYWRKWTKRQQNLGFKNLSMYRHITLWERDAEREERGRIVHAELGAVGLLRKGGNVCHLTRENIPETGRFCHFGTFHVPATRGRWSLRWCAPGAP